MSQSMDTFKDLHKATKLDIVGTVVAQSGCLLFKMRQSMAEKPKTLLGEMITRQVNLSKIET